MSKPSRSNQLVNQAKSSLQELDESKLADAIEELVVLEPLRWPQLLLLAGVFPEPSPKNAGAKANQLPQALSCLMKAMQILLGRDVDHVETVEEVVLTLKGFFTLQAYYSDILNELNKLAFVTSPPEIRIHRLVAMVEGQSWTIEQKLNEIHDVKNVVDLRVGQASLIPAKFDGSKASFGEAFDGLCETVELALRFILHNDPLPPQPAFQPERGPYKDPDFEKFLVLAGIWRAVAETWANMRFRGWPWTLDGHGHQVCAPVDRVAFVREYAGSLRYEMFVAERSLLRLAGLRIASAYTECLRAVSASITVPAAGQPWDGEWDIEQMKRLCDLAPLRAAVDEYVNRRHYLPLIDRTRVGSVGWREWVAGKESLYCLADAMSQAASEQVPDDDLACMRHVVVVREEALVDILMMCGHLTGSQSRDLLDALALRPETQVAGDLGPTTDPLRGGVGVSRSILCEDW